MVEDLLTTEEYEEEEGRGKRNNDGFKDQKKIDRRQDAADGDKAKGRTRAKLAQRKQPLWQLLSSAFPEHLLADMSKCSGISGDAKRHGFKVL